MLSLPTPPNPIPPSLHSTHLSLLSRTIILPRNLISPCFIPHKLSITTQSFLSLFPPKPIPSTHRPRTLGLYLMAIPVSATDPQTHQVEQKHVYSVWAVPPDDVAARLKKLMEVLRSEFGGPQFEPHITVVGAISLTPDDALSRFRSACDGLKAYTATVDRVATGTFFYQCVYVLIHPTTQVLETSAHCSGHFGYKNLTPYMPHLSLLYGDLTDDEKSRAQEKASILDESISSLSFPVSRLALYKTDTEDKTLKSWEKIAEYSLSPN